MTSASWTPFYDARLATGTKAQAPKLQLVRRASIQQRTGEIWDNVALSLSTARPGAGTAAPQLGTMTVDYEGEGVVARPRSEMAPTDHVAQRRPGALASPARTSDAARQGRRRNDAAEEVRATVDTQGFQAVYGIPGRATVPATGEIKRVQIDDMALDPALTVRTVPKRDEKAYLYAKLTIARGTPILPGPVSLFRDATFVGSGRLPLLAPGEEHELGFGVDDAVKVRHAIAEEKRGESGIITSSKTDTRNFRMTVKNLRERPINLVVLDQVPVSQNADIKVELIGQDGAHQAEPRRQARRGGLGDEARAGRGEGHRARLPRHLAVRQEGDLRELSDPACHPGPERQRRSGTQLRRAAIPGSRIELCCRPAA